MDCDVGIQNDNIQGAEGHRGRPSAPVFSLQTGDTLEVFRVVRHQRESDGQRVRGDQGVESADWRSLVGQRCRDGPKAIGRGSVKSEYRDRVDEGVDEPVELPGPLSVGSEPQLGPTSLS